MGRSRTQRLISQAERVLAGERSLSADELDHLLTDCVAQLLSLRAEIRRLEGVGDQLERTIAELRGLRERRADERASI